MKVLIHCLALLLSAAATSAQAQAHQHGVVQLDVAIDGSLLSLQLDAPLDSLLGFEHRPRTTTERAAAAALLKTLDPGAALWRPNAEAQCTLIKTTLASPLLLQASTATDDEHADLEGSWEFRCARPEQLRSIALGLFDAFKRIQRITVQVAGAKGQLKRELQRPNQQLLLTR
jgi:hypothetical protein